MKRQLPRGKLLIVTTALAFGGLAASAAAVQLAQAAAIAAGAAAAAPGIAWPGPRSRPGARGGRLAAPKSHRPVQQLHPRLRSGPGPQIGAAAAASKRRQARTVTRP